MGMRFNQLYHWLKEFINRPFVLLDTLNQRLRFVIISGLFVILFINIFKPFNIDRWFDIPARWEPLFYSSFGLISILVVGLSQFAVKPLFKPSNLKVAGFWAWSLGEIVILTIIFDFFFAIDNLSFSDFKREFGFTFRYTILVAGLAYTFSLLVNRILLLPQKINVFDGIKPDYQGVLIPFHDENGNFKFSLKQDYILYIEAADNYVIINILDGDKIQKQMLRNSLKNLETELKPFGIVRCHRSFMVRSSIIMQVKKEPKRYLLILSNGQKIPASLSFYDTYVANSGSENKLLNKINL